MEGPQKNISFSTILPGFIKELIGFGAGSKRTNKAKKNIAASFIIKGITISIGLVQVPIAINYLGATEYGIWITLSSLVGWMSFFNIGLGNGLRNKFAEALAKNNKDLARIYVSTTYGIIGIIVVIILLVFILVNHYLNWNSILNVENNIVPGKELSLLAFALVTIFCSRLVIKLLATVLTADQRPALADFINVIGNVVALILIIILTSTTEGSLLYISVTLSGTPILFFLIASLWFYNKEYKDYRPAFRWIRFDQAKPLFNLGIKFFIIQISSVLLFQTNNIIITQLFGPENVTPYNIAFKYFSVLMMGYSIVIAPFWSAYTEAWAKNENEWIKKTIFRLKQLWIIQIVIGILMLLFSKWIYHLWVGDKVSVPLILSFLVFIWIIINSWNLLFSQFFNGIGIIKIQLIIVIISSVINIPLAIFLGKILGIGGVILSNITVGLVITVILPIQYYKVINNKAVGIWRK